MLPPLPCHEVALIDKAKDKHLVTKGIYCWFGWNGWDWENHFEQKNIIICSTTNMTNLVFWKM
jgi:hypothetical protein